MVAHTHRRHIIYIDIAEDTRHTEHVLTFQVRTVAPTEHFYSEGVFSALLQEVGDVKFRHVVGALRVTYIFSVDPHICCRVDTAEVENRALFIPVSGHGERTHVRTYGIDAIVLTTVVITRTRLDKGRCISVGIFYVTIDGAVVSVHFPV